MTEQLTLQAGKRYFREDFEVTGELKGGVRGVFFDPTHGKTYVETGIEQSIKSSSDFTLVREYIEPTGILSTLTPENREKALNYEGVESHGPTAEPQNEYGPWEIWNGGECPVKVGARIQVQIREETRYAAEKHTHTSSKIKWDHTGRGYDIIAYRIKKSPVVKRYPVYFNGRGFLNGEALTTGSDKTVRNAIITLTDGKPSIAWAD